MSVFTGLTDFDPAPSLQTSASVTVSTKADEGAPVIGYLVARDGDDPGEHEWDGVAFEAAGFEGHVGQTIALPSADGPLTVLVGVGELETSTPTDSGMQEPPLPEPPNATAT